MWKDHGVDITIRCAEIVASKRKEDETIKKVSSYAPKKSTKKVSPKIDYEYFWDDGTPCTKAEYENALNEPDEEEVEVKEGL
jgi:hypothetical protein